MTPRTKEQNEEIRLRRIREILRAAAEVYLDKGIVLEIRDVAAAAGLGYGTVYHYYNNKNDLVSDMLYQGLERAEALWAGELSPAGGAGSGNEKTASAGEDRNSYSKERDSLHVRERLREACAVLLRAWERDRALFLACYLGTDQYRMLQPETAALLSPVYRSNVLLPVASRVKTILVQEASHSSNARQGAEAERQAEWLLAALAACALPSVRRGTLKGEMEGLIRFAAGRGFV
ncbi:TetR/AcrR family transcriptional regulator [Paenibacillus brevis]|uniref:TetR/AcrR family transcriptional regulator helix-turn-helix transcriptional regulator n=1 Tax=Paenibacillus brevis TaxID=2841508 RepID=A0ABS6FRS7_9BACL|nr:TetR/AcrR family transcriptional regulator [Paenibacillus brevis]MBU5672906.1 TetR/AcrR family transcriptional regulator; helix-turn-helix transcriptional regulator [Paenibacillus brevis]